MRDEQDHRLAHLASISCDLGPQGELIARRHQALPSAGLALITCAEPFPPHATLELHEDLTLEGIDTMRQGRAVGGGFAVKNLRNTTILLAGRVLGVVRLAAAPLAVNVPHVSLPGPSAATSFATTTSDVAADPAPRRRRAAQP